VGTCNLVSADAAETEIQDAATDEAADLRMPAARLTVVLVCILTVAALVAAATVGYLVHHQSSSAAAVVVPVTSVDAGFARDMSTHHEQAVTMAGYERDNTTNPSLKLLAYDIETSQEDQIGEMQGWLDVWGLSRSTTIRQMAWMTGHSLESDGLMPGMATPAQMDRLETMHGRALDVFFLQLMIVHHEGGLSMETYAAQNATQPYVRNLAAKMVQNQSADIIAMEQLLRQLGGSPLPPPAD
jgi:uncharacterized protein (DUF305 family)